MTSTDNKRSLLSIFRSRTKLSYSSEINASDSEFRIRQLNDFATECIRKEKTDLEEADSLRLASLCPSKHGGLLDYPKIVTESAGRLSEKWDRCWDSLARCLQSTLAPDKNRCSGLILFPEIDVYTSSKPLELKEFVGPFKRN